MCDQHNTKSIFRKKGSGVTTELHLKTKIIETVIAWIYIFFRPIIKRAKKKKKKSYNNPTHSRCDVLIIISKNLQNKLFLSCYCTEQAKSLVEIVFLYNNPKIRLVKRWLMFFFSIIPCHLYSSFKPYVRIPVFSVIRFVKHALGLSLSGSRSISPWITANPY